MIRTTKNEMERDSVERGSYKDGSNWSRPQQVVSSNRGKVDSMQQSSEMVG